MLPVSLAVRNTSAPRDVGKTLNGKLSNKNDILTMEKINTSLLFHELRLTSLKSFFDFNIFVFH